MARMSKEDRDRLLKKKAQIEARIRDYDAAASKQKRADETRLKIIHGALVLDHGHEEPGLADMMKRLIERYVTRPHDRKLLGLPDLEQGNKG
jgi:hypothetical protein